MRFENLSVARKVWLLVVAVMVLLVGASIGMGSYMAQLEARLRDDVQDMEDRMRSAMQLRAGIEIGASAIMAAELASDEQSHEFFEVRFRSVQAENVKLMQDLGARLVTDRGREIFKRLIAHVTKADALIHSLDTRRENGENVGVVVRTELMPVLQQFVQELDSMVALQRSLLEAGLEKAKAQRTQGWVIGGAVVVVVCLLGLAFAWVLVRQLTLPLSKAVALANEIAQGNLSQNVHDARGDEMGMLLRALNDMTLKLRAVVGEVRQGVHVVSDAAGHIEQGNLNLSERTQHSASSLEETAASIEELAATVSQSADTARQANQLAATAVQAAERGGEVVSQVVMSMDQINTSSRKISDIIGVIDGIAFQTNILALNAAVEAARAGEQGRGFAVVAGEVRSLAGRSAEAAKEIKDLITASVSNVDIGAAQVAQAGESMQEIVASVRRVTDLIGELSASAQEQRDGITQVNQAVSNLDQMTQQNAALVEESSAAASSMNTQAQRLAQVVSMFNLGQTVAMSVSKAATSLPSKAASQPAVHKEVAVKQEPSVSKEAAPKPQQKLSQSAPAAHTVAGTEDDWETF